MILDTERHLDDEAIQLGVVRRCQRYARLQQRGARSRADEKQLAALERLLGEEAGPSQRGHRRFPLIIPATIYTERGRFDATALNISGSGLFLVTTILLTPGSRVRVTIGRGSGAVSLRCTARRINRYGATIGIGFQFAPRAIDAPLTAAA